MDTFKYEVLDAILSYRNGAQMQQNCVSTAGKTMYRCKYASLYSSKNHVSLADLVMVGPGKLMVGHRP